MPLNKSQSGFTLLEVLVAIVVLSLGLLGLAGLQAATLRNNQIAYYRTIAIQQTYDMADRIRANQAGVTAGAYDDLDTSTPADPDCVANTCSAAEMATADHSQWNNNNNRMLPAGTGNVVSGGDGSFVITVSWTERTEAANPVVQSFVTRVMP